MSGFHHILMNLISTPAWASPIDYTKVSDDSLYVMQLMTIALLIIQAALGIWALIRYRKKRRETGKGWPTWAVLVTVGAIILFWIVVFIYYVRGQGAEYIG